MKHLSILMLVCLLNTCFAQNTVRKKKNPCGGYFHHLINSEQPVSEEDLNMQSCDSVVGAMVDEMLDKMGLEKNIRVYKSDSVSDVGGAVLNRERFILYNEKYLQKQSNGRIKSSWKIKFELAHEIGHHLNYHSILENSNITNELTADRFAGWILHALGAKKEEMLEWLMQNAPAGGTPTHPPKSERISAAIEGYNSFKETFSGGSVSSVSTSNSKIENVFDFNFYDGFVDNKNLWDIRHYSSDSLKFDIKNNKYYIENKQLNSASYSTLNFSFDFNKDFIIETEVSLINNSDRQYAGITWGQSALEKSSSFHFIIFRNNFYQIYYSDEGKTANIKTKTSTSFIDDRINVLKISKEGNRLKFFINNQIVTELPYEKVYGSFCGFDIGVETKITVNYFKVSGYKL